VTLFSDQSVPLTQNKPFSASTQNLPKNREAGANYKQPLKISMAARAGLVPSIRNFFRAVLLDNDYPSGMADDIEVLLDEGIFNVIRHTYKFAEGKKIELSLEMFPDRVLLKIRDWGPVFESSKIPKVDLDSYASQGKLGGLGVYMMERLSDRMEFKHGKKIGNTLIL
jgi:anti-sigma regulatory factor (Ser/Thr protein kinase)